MVDNRNTTRQWTDRVFTPDDFAGPDRRFKWLPADIPAAQEGLKHLSPYIRAATAFLRTQVLFEEAVRLYVGDFAALAKKSLTIQAKNAPLTRRVTDTFDPSLMNSSQQMQKMMTDMMASATKESFAYWNERYNEILPAVLMLDFEAVASFWEKQVTVLDIVVNANPRALKSINEQMGCKWNDQKRYRFVTETPRAILYQVLPLKEGVEVRTNGKPVLHFAPLILQTVILDLLPYQNLSYVGAFADSGTPTYFMVTKEITSTADAQKLTEEELVIDIEYFTQTLYETYKRKVVLNGTCQGALPLLHAVCAKARRLDKYVDCWIGLVPAYSLHASSRVRADMEKIPESKRNDLEGITELLGSGNRVIPGEIAGFATRLKTDPWTELVRAMRNAEKGESSLMGLAIQEYLRKLIPMSVPMMEMSHTCASKPISEEGTFPTLLFGELVSLKYAIKRGIKLYVVAGERDEVVDLEAALRMFDISCIKAYSGASYHVVPGAGHIALMTTCARETSKNFIGNKGGPLWYHLKLEAEE